MTFDPTEEIGNDEASSIIQRSVSCNGIILSGHAKTRMQERGYLVQDVEHILLNGKIVDKDFNEKAGNWKYRMHGQDLEGDDGSLVVAIVTVSSVVLVTVLS